MATSLNDMKAQTQTEYHQQTDTNTAAADTATDTAADTAKAGTQADVSTASSADPAVRADQEQTKTKEAAVRFVHILSDNSYIYYLDSESVRWIPCPHTNQEQMLEVWLKLMPETDHADQDAQNYSYPDKYYLEHYYIRPDTRQIQFLCELEVTGRPSNAVSQRPYSSLNWEDLVPNSIEDAIYHAVMEHVDKKSPHVVGNQNSIRDGIEEYLRISL